MNANDQDLEQLSALFRVLSDKTRLQILTILSGGEKNVSAICKVLRLPQPTVSHHLSLLRMNNVVDHRRNGKQVIYSLDGRIDANEKDLLLSLQNLVVRISPRGK